MKSFFLVLFTTAAFGSVSNIPQFRFDSAHSVILNASLSEGVLTTEATQTQMIQDELLVQLFYLLGPLNAYGAAPDLAHSKIEIKKIEEMTPPLKKVTFRASLRISWPKEVALPTLTTIPLPLKTDEKGIAGFFSKYSKSCSEEGADNAAESFYYFFRPGKDGCILKTAPVPADVSVIQLTYGTSTENTQGKSPEYGKIWEDDKLVATVIFGTNRKGAVNPIDAGINQYNTLYLLLRKNFGTPSYMNVTLPADAKPGKQNPDIEMTFPMARGKEFNINILLIDKMGLLEPTKEFLARYNQRTEISDYISYNGHSGYGDNIQALAKLGHFKKGQYQIYFVNGCDTFAYVDDALSEAHVAVNPGEGPYRYFDIVTNAMPSAFKSFADANYSFLKALIEKRQTYAQTLSSFDPLQKAIVMGEEDNRWPSPF